MDKEQLFAMLKENMRVTVDQEDIGSNQLTVSIYFDDKLVCTGYHYLSITDRDNY